MQIRLSSLQNHNVNCCGISRHLARKFTLFPYTTLFRSVFFWAVVHDRPICWATRRKNWPKDRRPESLPVFAASRPTDRSEEHTSELQSRFDLVCRPLHEKKK